MDPEQLEAEALKLEPSLRARLAERLFMSLDSSSEGEWNKLWVSEALHRNTEMDANPSVGIPADEVFRKAYSKFK